MKGKSTPKRDSFTDAADKAGVPIGEFMEWAYATIRVSRGQWDHWRSGHRPVPEKYVIQFLRDKMARSPAAHDPVAPAAPTGQSEVRSLRPDSRRSKKQA